MLLTLAALAAGLALFSGQPVRALSPGEQAALEPLFCDSLPWPALRVRAARLPARVTAFALGETIVVRYGYYSADLSSDPWRLAILAHEAAHLWAWRHHGQHRALAALAEHLTRGERVYGYRPFEGAFEALGWEQQGQAVYDLTLARALGRDAEALQAWVTPALCRS